MSTDTREMLAIHDALRQEVARFGLLVKGAPEGDAERAAVIGGHIEFMSRILHAHHEGEDVLLYPLLRERQPEHADLFALMDAEHSGMDELVATLLAATQAWTANPSAENRAQLHVAVFPLERALLAHLSKEEEAVLPLAAESLSQEEFGAIGVHSRASLPPDQLALALGFILDDTSAELGDLVRSGMPPEALAGFEQFGMPLYRSYRDRLLDLA